MPCEECSGTGGADGSARVGITAFAQDALGDVVLVSLPAVGDTVTAGDSCGEVESTKSVSEINAPVSGTVTAVNAALDATPELVNTDPYGEGWMFEIGDVAPGAVDELGPPLAPFGLVASGLVPASSSSTSTNAPPVTSVDASSSKLRRKPPKASCSKNVGAASTGRVS